MGIVPFDRLMLLFHRIMLVRMLFAVCGFVVSEKDASVSSVYCCQFALL